MSNIARSGHLQLETIDPALASSLTHNYLACPIFNISCCSLQILGIDTVLSGIVEHFRRRAGFVAPVFYSDDLHLAAKQDCN
jgi:hypothetical protein